MIQELKIAIGALTKAKLYNSPLRRNLINDLINLLEAEENESAVEFWNNQL